MAAKPKSKKKAGSARRSVDAGDKDKLIIEQKNRIAALENELRLKKEDATSSDIAERKQAEEVWDNDALLRAITEDTTDLIFVKDCKGRVIFGNPALYRVIGKPREAVFGKCDREFYDDPAMGEAIMANDRRIMESGRTSRSSKRWRLITRPTSPPKHPTVKYGEIIGIIGISRDVSNRKRAEEELRQSHDELELRVQERTLELQHYNVYLSTHIEERKRTAGSGPELFEPH